MTDKDVAHEIEENQRRARDEQDVGLEEDVLRRRNDDGTLLDKLGDALLGRDNDSREREVEYSEDDSKLPPE